MEGSYMNESYEKLYFACDYEAYRKVQQAMEGLNAYEAETAFDQYVYFYAMVDKKDLEEFNRRLSTP